MRYRFATAAAAGLLLAATNLVQAERTVPAPFAGRAYDTAGTLRYTEAHAFEPVPGGVRSVTVYRDAAGRVIGRMEADYSAHAFAPDYRMIDYRFDSEQVVRRRGETVEIEHREGDRRKVKRVRVDGDRPVIIGPGFNEFIRTHWNELLAGRTLVADFVIPSRQQVIGFRIKHDPDHGSASAKAFTVGVDNVLLRLVAPTLRVEYHHETRQLLGYEGPTHVTDADDRVQKVTIRFPGGEPVVTASAQND